MESSGCRRPTAEELYSVTKLEPVMVKEELDWGDCDVSEVAAVENLYADHEVKHEVVIGPELVQEQNVVHSTQKMLIIKEEKCVQELAAEEGKALICCTGDSPRCKLREDQRYRLKSCSVRLQRLPDGDLCRYNSYSNNLKEETGKNQPVCNICNKRFTLKKLLNRHMLIHSDVEQYSCHVCDKRFRYKWRLTQHVRVHTGENFIICNVCDKQFVEKSCLVRHLRLHTVEKTRGILTSHKRRHTGEKPYHCNVCNKSFRAKATLTTHKAIHSVEKRYSCTVCDKRFKIKGALNTHMLTHSGEKPYNCDVCNRQFRTKSTLTSHIMTHSGDKPHGCEVCEKRFRRKSTLNVHKLVVHTGERSFGCDVCGRWFKLKGHLKDHSRLHLDKIPFRKMRVTIVTQPKAHSPLNTLG